MQSEICTVRVVENLHARIEKRIPLIQTLHRVHAVHLHSIQIDK